MNENTGKLILRLTLGILIAAARHRQAAERHRAGIGAALEESGLPAFFKYGVYVGEVDRASAPDPRLLRAASAPG